MGSHVILLVLLGMMMPASWAWVVTQVWEKNAERKKIKAWDSAWKRNWEIENRFPFEFCVRDIKFQLKRSNWLHRWTGFFMLVLIVLGAGLVVANTRYLMFLSQDQVVTMLWIDLFAILGLFLPIYDYYGLDKNLHREKLIRIREIIYREQWDAAQAKRVFIEQKRLHRLKFGELEEEHAREQAEMAALLKEAKDSIPVATGEEAAPLTVTETPQASESFTFPELEEERVVGSASLVDKIKEMGADPAARAVKTFLAQDQA